VGRRCPRLGDGLHGTNQNLEADMTGLNGKVAIVTGGGSGLGEAIAKRLAKQGVKVLVSDINISGAERVAQDIASAGGTASAVEQDTARPEDSERVVSHAVSTYGALHYAVNNAGIGGAQAPAGEVDLADWERVIDINLNGVLYGMRYQIPAMLKAGARSSAIVNMASIHGAVAAVGNGAYTLRWFASCFRTKRPSSPGGTTLSTGATPRCDVTETSSQPRRGTPFGAAWKLIMPSTE
jgi:NADP-dependent 3-hydroxy acid dehydrogenase YdfG